MQTTPVVPLQYQSDDDPLPRLAQGLCWGALLYCTALALYMTFHGMWNAAQVRLGMGRPSLEMLLFAAGGDALCALAAATVAAVSGLVLRGWVSLLRLLMIGLWALIVIRVSMQLVEVHHVVQEQARIAGTFGWMGKAGLLGVHLSGVVLVTIMPGLFLILLSRPSIRVALARAR
jgi:hypothetical protein